MDKRPKGLVRRGRRRKCKYLFRPSVLTPSIQQIAYGPSRLSASCKSYTYSNNTCLLCEPNSFIGSSQYATLLTYVRIFYKIIHNQFLTPGGITVWFQTYIHAHPLLKPQFPTVIQTQFVRQGLEGTHIPIIISLTDVIYKEQER
jgi:hypothetical protein